VLYRAWLLFWSVVAVALTFDAGWLEIPGQRLGGIVMLAIAAGLALYALRPLRRR
jgi:hypothetical protein